MSKEVWAYGPKFKGRYQRRSLDVANISGLAYITIQRGRTYFENQDKIAVVRATFTRVHEVKLKGMTAAEIFVNQTP